MTRLIHFLAVVVFILLTTSGLSAQRTPVLPQIDLPHSYYFREMYLPQLTSGPSSADWTADGLALVFSMGGSLWIQQVNSEYAEQLTDGEGYDYQPDVSPDGRRVVFVRYTGQAMELMLFDIESRRTISLTTDKFVNVEPRWSPDGSSLAFVSTRGTGHFLLYRAQITGDKLQEITCLTPDRKSDIKRYYYSAWDHALHPSWAPDGKEIIFVSNREVAHGTGNLVKMDLATGNLTTLQKEETNWRVFPDVSPDGSRIIYGSYAGRNFHQLWTVPVGGGYPFAFTTGDFDNTFPRWSPDGKSIVFVSNREGNLSLWILDVFQGTQRRVRTSQMTYLKPRQTLRLEVRNEQGERVPARVSITDSRGKFHAPNLDWIHADDAIFAAHHKFEQHYFYSNGASALQVPSDKLLITVSKGPRYELFKVNVDASKPLNDKISVVLKSFTYPVGFDAWQSADLHVHMNYGGTYLNNPQQLLRQASAEDVQFVFNLIVNKEQRVPDSSLFTPETVASSSGDAVLLYGEEFHTSFWGHMGLLGLTKNLITPVYSAYPQTSAASLFPDNNWVARKTRDQQGLVGYVHPFEVAEVTPTPASGLTNQVPVTAALGLVDYYEVIGFADHRASETVWHQLLNCGLRIPAGAGTDLMGNYSSLRGPLGLNRVMVQGSGAPDKVSFLEKLKAGKSIVTNGPVIGFSVNGKLPGDRINISPSGETLNYSAFLRSPVPLEFLEVIWNGKVVATHTLLDSKRFADVTGKIKVKGPGWIVLRAGSRTPHPDLMDLYPFATTNPVYVETPDQTHFRSAEAAAWFMPWVTGIKKVVMESTSFRTEIERKEIMDQVEEAIGFYEGIAGKTSSKNK